MSAASTGDPPAFERMALVGAWRAIIPPAARTSSIGINIAGFIGFSLSGPDQSDRLVAFEQIEADSRRLAARAGKAAIALEQQLRVALGDRRECGHIFGRRGAKRFLAGLAGPEDFPRTPQSQIFFGDPEAVTRLAHQCQPGTPDVGQILA